MGPEDRNLAEGERWIWTAPEHLTARSEHQNGTFSASYENVRAAAIMSGCIVKTGLFQDSLSQYRTFSGERINRVRSGKMAFCVCSALPQKTVLKITLQANNSKLISHNQPFKCLSLNLSYKHLIRMNFLVFFVRLF